MTPQRARAEIYELARVLRALGDAEGAARVVDALLFTEEAAVLTALGRLKVIQGGKGNDEATECSAE
jgi:hypothetical protein